MRSILSSITPASLKKYGLYAILSFFMSATIFLGTDDIKVRNTDMTSERQKNKELQDILNSQSRLKEEQDSLLTVYRYFQDTTKLHK